MWLRHALEVKILCISKEEHTMLANAAIFDRMIAHACCDAENCSNKGMLVGDAQYKDEAAPLVCCVLVFTCVNVC